MSMRQRLLFIVAISFYVLGETHYATASTLHEPCSELGKTVVSSDQHSMLACLYDESHALVWTSMATQENTLSSIQKPAASLSRWQGWYAGVNSGLSDTNTSFQKEYSAGTTNLHRYSGTAGLLGGYNQVQPGGLLYGVELDVNYMGNSLSDPSADTKSKWQGYATARGRIGMAFDPALLYLTGGMALVDVSNKWNTFDENILTPPFTIVPYGFSDRTIHVGWTIGAGTEFALTDHISFSALYLLLEMPQTSRTAYDSVNGATSKFLLDNSANILRVGLNYHFN